jgi:hypothetical protein
MSKVPKPGDVINPKQRELYRFARCPLGLLRAPLLSPGAKLCWIVLANCNGPDGCFPGHEYLAAALGASVRSVRYYIRELTAAGLIRIERPEVGPDRRNRYVFLWQDALNYGQDSAPTKGQDLVKQGAKFGRVYKEDLELNKRKEERARRTSAARSSPKKLCTAVIDPDSIDWNLPESEVDKWRH